MNEKAKLIKKTIRSAIQVLKTRGWIKLHMAEDALGNTVDPTHACAEKFCVAGAVSRVTGATVGSSDISLFSETMSVLHESVRCGDITLYNDDSKRKLYQVINAMKRAANRVR